MFQIIGSSIRFVFLILLKILALIFYRFEVKWLNDSQETDKFPIKMLVLLNHTSLYEPIFLGILPFGVIWQIASQSILPGAEKTLNRPIVGRFFKLLAPKVIPITRNRDHTWKKFLDAIDEKSIILIAPEGRMKRPTGLDKEGNPMTVRGGVADLLNLIDSGQMLIAYSGGLHHVQSPGQFVPNVFKKIKVSLEICDIEDYKKKNGFGESQRKFTLAIAKDMEKRRDEYCPVS